MSDDLIQYYKRLGWNSFFQNNFSLLEIPETIPARVISESKDSYRLFSQYGELSATVTGKMRYRQGTSNIHPVVGDWVVVKPIVDELRGMIHAVLPRTSKFSRKVA